MIVKMGEPIQGDAFKVSDCQHCAVKKVVAVKMKEDFLFETTRGWVQGYKGQWLVEMGGHVRISLDDGHFKKLYVPEANGN